MITVYGHRLYGKVDAVPGVGHVATKFFHVDYLPLFPTETWLVTQQSGKSWRGVKIPLSAKSVFVGWGRAFSLIAGVVSTIAAIAMSTGRRPEPASIATAAGVAVACWGFFALTKLHKVFNRASYARACQLAKLVQMNDAGLTALAAAYGEAPPTFGFRPVMPAAGPVAVVPAVPTAVEIVEDETPGPATGPAPVTATTPLRGY